MRATLGIAVLLAVAACGRIGFDRPGGDAGSLGRDAGPRDAGPRGIDAGPRDAGPLGIEDAGPRDAGPAHDAGPSACPDVAPPIVAYDFGGSEGPTYPDIAPAPPDVPVTAAGAVSFDATSAILAGGELANLGLETALLVDRLRAAPGFSVLIWISPATVDQVAGVFAFDQADVPIVTLSQGPSANAYRFSDDRDSSSHFSGLRPWTAAEIDGAIPRLMALTYDVATGRVEAYENGTTAGFGSDHAPGARIRLASEPALRLGHTAFSLEPGYWRGRIYRVEIHERALGAGEILCVYDSTPVP